MTAHTPTHPIGSAHPQHAGRRAVLLVLAVVLATLMATVAVTSAVSSLRGTPSHLPAPAPVPTQGPVQDDLHPNQGWTGRRGGAPAPTQPLTWPHGKYHGA